MPLKTIRKWQLLTPSVAGSELKEDPQAEQRLAAFLSMKDTMMLLPMRDGIMRLVAVESQVTDASNDTPSLAHFQALFDEVAPGKGTLHSPVWLTRFHLHHRIANKFRNGRLFVAGGMTFRMFLFHF